MSDEQQYGWSKAFVSLDGGKPPAEVKVIAGYGYVNEIQEKERSLKITFMAHKDGKPREYLPSAWIPRSEEEIVKILRASFDKKRNIFYRFEIRRQDKIDRAIPIEELTPLAVAKDSIFRGIAAVKIRESDDWMFTKAALTNPAEDPQNERFQSAVGQEPRNFSQGGNASDEGSGSHRGNSSSIEPPTFVTLTKSGEVNPGSLAVSAPLGAYTLAVQLGEKFNVDLDKKKRGVLAAAILKMSGAMQVAIWGGKLKSPDMGANSFNRARYFIEQVILADEPLTADIFEEESLRDWQERVETEALKLWRWSVKMVEKTIERGEESDEED